MLYLGHRARSGADRVSRMPATVEVLDPDPAERDLPLTGALQSVQEAEVTLPSDRREKLWAAETLERLAGAYWAYVSRLFLGLVRVVYEPTSTTVVLVSKRLPLLRFHAPEYETEDDGSGGCVTWPIDRGLLVASEGRGRGQLRIRVHSLEPAGEDMDRIRVRVAVRNFYPWLRGRGRFARLGTWIYGRTQLALHVIACNGFLRSLARLELPEPPRAADDKRPPARVR